MKTAIDCLSENAVAMNDTLFDKKVVAEKDRKRHDRDAPNDGKNAERIRKLERDLQIMLEKVDAITTRMDQDLRKMIDTREHFNSIRPVLEEIGNEADVFARANPTSSQIPSTQRTRSQRRARRPADNDHLDGDEEDEEDEEYHDFTPTDPTNAQTQSTQRPPATITLFKQKLQLRKDRYQDQSHRVRYAQDNDYRNFRKTLHDARYGGDAPPLPHESLWFNDDGVSNLARPGETDLGGVQGEDSDDDLQIAKAKISIKCPITLVEFEDPVTSTKCPHSFERNAIMGMIDGSAVRVGGSNRRGANDGKKAVKCPASGCEQVLTKDDLHTDARLVHHIKRIQRAAEEQDDDDDEDENENGAKNRPHSIASDDSDDDEVDVDDVERQEREQAAKRIKLERFSQRQR